MEVVSEKKVGIPCPVCDARLVSTSEMLNCKCPKCNIEFTDYDLREYWDFI